MFRSNSDALVFLAPGLVHQFGNLLLTIQGHALQLGGPGRGESRAQQAILHASERGGTTLRVLRILLGEPGELLVPAVEVLELFGELARVPVREAGHRLELRVSPALRRQVAANEFFPTVTAAVQLLVAAAPRGMGGRLCIELTAADNAVDADLRFVAEAGNLPFPLRLDGPLATLVAALRARADRTTAHCQPGGLRLQFVALPMPGEACADLHDSLPEGS